MSVIFLPDDESLFVQRMHLYGFHQNSTRLVRLIADDLSDEFLDTLISYYHHVVP